MNLCFTLLFCFWVWPVRFVQHVRYISHIFLLYNHKQFFFHHAALCFWLYLFSGKRACVGESLARMELFIFLVSLLQHFTFSCTGGPDSINLVPEYSSFANLPRTYEIIATPRWNTDSLPSLEALSHSPVPLYNKNIYICMYEYKWYRDWIIRLKKL